MDIQGADTLEKGLQDAPPPYPGLEDGKLYPVLTTTGKFYQYPHLFMSINITCTYQYSRHLFDNLYA